MSRTIITLQNDSMIGEDRVEIAEPTLDVTLELDTDTQECQKCGQPIAKYVEPEWSDGWIHETTSNATCNNLTDAEILDEMDVEQDYVYSASDLDSLGIDYATAYPESPGDWVNWVGATVGKDYVEVQMSFGDPRGCLSLRAWRGEDENGNPITFLSVPHPDQSAPHVALIPHHLGTFIIGGA